MSALATVRPIRDTGELARVDPIRERAGFSAIVLEEMRWAHRVGTGETFLAEDGDEALGASAALLMGSTGWIGGVCVEPQARRRGIGTAVTEAAVAWLRERGARTVLLYATDLGLPIYERMGFAIDGAAELWVGRAPEPAFRRGLRAATEADLDAALRLDRAATGEDRSVVARASWPARSFVYEHGGDVLGATMASAFRGSTAVAADADAGLAVLHASIALQAGEVRVGVPAGNGAAIEFLAGLRFRRDLTTPRMRLGPPVGARPDRLFRLYNLFWG
jgi:GNAT superfamily N-acetyltransferase